MIGQIALVKNWKDIEKASSMNMDEPDEIYEYMPFGFRLDDVSRFHLETGDRIIIMFDDKTFVIKHEKEIYEKLLEKFNE